MFDFSKRLEDFETGKPTGGRGARGKYNREERAPRSGGASGGRGGERRGFGPGHAPSRDGGTSSDRPAFGGERKSFGSGAPGRTSYNGGSGRGGRPSFGGRGSSFGGGSRGRSGGGGRRLPPQPSYKQYMFTPTDDSGELKFTPYEVTKKFHDFVLDDFVIKNIDKKGYEKPTEIQEKTLQAIMD